MKITFLVPPALGRSKALERIFGCNYGVYFQPNIFMLYPAAVLEKEGYDVRVIDAPVEKKTWEDIENFLENDDSDIYCFYTVYLAKPIDLYVLKKIRQIRGRQINVFFMGPEPTSVPDQFLLDDSCFVVRGEAELTTLELVKAVENGSKLEEIKGISWRNNDIRHNPPRPLLKNYDILPFPARHLIKRELYHNPKLKNRPSTVILTSRNCPHRCIYCIPCSHSFAREVEYKRYHGRKPAVGLRSPENVVEEFKHLRREGYRSVAIIDDNFVWGAERTTKICKGIEDLDMEWGCLARADYLLDEQMLKAMSDSGCRYVDLGVESFNQVTLDYIHKDMKVDTIFEAIELLRKNNIEPKINVLFGCIPFETKESIGETVKRLKELDIDYVSFGVVLPHRDTEFYKIAKKRGWMLMTSTGDFVPADPYRESTISYPNLSAEDLEEAVRWAYRSFYLRPRYIFKRLKSIGSLKELRENLKTALKLFR